MGKRIRIPKRRMAKEIEDLNNKIRFFSAAKLRVVDKDGKRGGSVAGLAVPDTNVVMLSREVPRKHWPSLKDHEVAHLKGKGEVGARLAEIKKGSFFQILPRKIPIHGKDSKMTAFLHPVYEINGKRKRVSQKELDSLFPKKVRIPKKRKDGVIQRYWIAIARLFKNPVDTLTTGPEFSREGAKGIGYVYRSIPGVAVLTGSKTTPKQSVKSIHHEEMHDILADMEMSGEIPIGSSYKYDLASIKEQGPSDEKWGKKYKAELLKDFSLPEELRILKERKRITDLMEGLNKREQEFARQELVGMIKDSDKNKNGKKNKNT